jgi:hypothetical protein
MTAGIATLVPASNPHFISTTISFFTYQDVISSLQYNHQNCYLHDVNKQRPLAAILATAASILKEPLPIKCIEAVSGIQRELLSAIVAPPV